MNNFIKINSIKTNTNFNPKSTTRPKSVAKMKAINNINLTGSSKTPKTHKYTRRIQSDLGNNNVRNSCSNTTRHKQFINSAYNMDSSKRATSRGVNIGKKK